MGFCCPLQPQIKVSSETSDYSVPSLTVMTSIEVMHIRNSVPDEVIVQRTEERLSGDPSFSFAYRKH